MRKLLSLAILAALAYPAVADGCEPNSSSAEVDALGYYADWDQCIGDTCHIVIWIYQESNGIPGLQRGDEVVDNTCGGKIPADTIVF